jgi:hypothetical protein
MSLFVPALPASAKLFAAEVQNEEGGTKFYAPIAGLRDPFSKFLCRRRSVVYWYSIQ